MYNGESFFAMSSTITRLILTMILTRCCTNEVLYPLVRIVHILVQIWIITILTYPPTELLIRSPCQI